MEVACESRHAFPRMWRSAAADWELWLAQVQEADAMLAEQQRVYRDFDALPSMQALTG